MDARLARVWAIESPAGASTPSTMVLPGRESGAGSAEVWNRGAPTMSRIGGDVRYQLVQLAQLGFALLLMFGAFIGGVVVGWWRWGRVQSPARSDEAPSIGSAGLFTPEDREDEVVLADLRETAPVTQRSTDPVVDPMPPPLFATSGRNHLESGSSFSSGSARAALPSPEGASEDRFPR